jgi:Tol biopolymer transport system component
LRHLAAQMSALVVLSPIVAGAAGKPAAPGGVLAIGTGPYVYAVRADGSGGHALGQGDYPAYSRTGSLAFTLNGVWVARADGTHRRQIVPRFADYLAYASPTWSPDGRRIAYIRVDSGHETSELWVVERDGKGLHGLAGVHAASTPTWSPDGRWIAYAGDGGLSEASPDGSRRRLLLRGSVWFPIWAPDGREIAFERPSSGAVATLLLDVASGSVTQIDRHAGPIGPIAWAPDGRWLALTTQRAGAGGAFVELRALRLADHSERMIARTYVQSLDGLSWR